MMSATVVYLPCLGQGLDCYREHLIELERVVSLWLCLGTHLGKLWGVEVAGLITDAAEKLLPHMQPRRPGGKIIL